MAKATPLRKWLAPSVPYTVVLRDEQGEFRHDFKLCFDLNALALIESTLRVNLLANFAAVFNVTATAVSVYFWAAAQAYQPEYAGEEGLDVIRSFFNAGNFEPAAEAVQAAFKLSLNDEQRARVEAALESARKLIEAGTPTPVKGSELPLAKPAGVRE